MARGVKPSTSPPQITCCSSPRPRMLSLGGTGGRRISSPSGTRIEGVQVGQYVSYRFFRIDPAWRRLPVEEREVLAYAGIVRQFSRKKELQRIIGLAVPVPESAALDESGLGISSAQLSVLLSELQEGVLLTDSTGRIIHLNRKAEKLLAHTLAQCLGQDSGRISRRNGVQRRLNDGRCRWSTRQRFCG